MTLLVTGASGLVGRALLAARPGRGLPRRPGESALWWTPGSKVHDDGSRFDAVVHLAGQNIASGRWTARVRAGIREIILPKANEAHLDDLTDEVRKMLTVHFVEDLEELLDLLLRDGVAKPVRKKSTGSRKASKKSGSDGSSGSVAKA